VLDTLTGGVGVGYEGGADARNLVRGYRGALPGATDEDAALGSPEDDVLGDLARVVRVVHRLGAVRAEVVHRVPRGA